MKKILLLLGAVLLAFSFVGCGKKSKKKLKEANAKIEKLEERLEHYKTMLCKEEAHKDKDFCKDLKKDDDADSASDSAVTDASAGSVTSSDDSDSSDADSDSDSNDDSNDPVTVSE